MSGSKRRNDMQYGYDAFLVAGMYAAFVLALAVFLREDDE